MKNKKEIIDAIKRYEKGRQLVQSLTNKRLSLRLECLHAEPYDYENICLVLAYNDTMALCKENNEYYSYDEVMDEGYADGDYCETCHQSYQIKKGPLADARKEFGEAKRALSRLGKILIGATQSNQNTTR